MYIESQWYTYTYLYGYFYKYLLFMVSGREKDLRNYTQVCTLVKSAVSLKLKRRSSGSMQITSLTTWVQFKLWNEVFSREFKKLEMTYWSQHKNKNVLVNRDLDKLIHTLDRFEFCKSFSFREDMLNDIEHNYCLGFPNLTTS